MITIKVPNVHDGLHTVLRSLAHEGVERPSRNGPVVAFPTPVTILFENPLERVLYWPRRDANPFFHVMESLWMLGGRNDVAFVSNYVGQMQRYSDDGKIFHGAYGYRWRYHFKVDQLDKIISELKVNPDSRRCYLGMWDPKEDLGREGRDLPCNVGCSFQINHDGAVDMVVHNRSNDIVWGAMGANAVHFSYLLEFIATSLGRPVGRYWQVSSNMHAYVEVLEKLGILTDQPADVCEHSCFPLMAVDYVTWRQDLEIFLKKGLIVGFREPFFRRVAVPMLMAHKAYRQQDNPDRFEQAIEILQQCKDIPWQTACTQWLQRRQVAHRKAQDDGVMVA